MKKADKVLILILLFLCMSLFLIQQTGRRQGASVLVEVDGETYGIYALAEDTVVQIQSTNCLVIKNGKVQMAEAQCPDQLCVKQGAISKEGQMIVCLPNCVTVQVLNPEEKEGQSSEIIPDAAAE